MPVASGLFGRAVAVAGGRVVIGAPSEGTPPASGRIHVFDLASGALLGTLDNPASGASDVFGFAVAAVGPSALVVGAPFDQMSRAVVSRKF